MPKHRTLKAGQNVLVKPVFHMPNGESCRTWTHLEYVAGRVVSVAEDGQSAVVEYFEFSTAPCSCGPNRQTRSTYFLREVVTGG